MRTGGRAVECSGLENRQTFTGLVGSNPTLSARWLARAFCGSASLFSLFLFFQQPVIGIGVGAWIGADRPVNDWKRIYDPGLTTGLYVGPAPRGRIAIGVTIAFDVPDGTY